MPHILDFSKVIHYLDDECFSLVDTLTNSKPCRKKKVVWVMGSSVVYWASRSAISCPKGNHLTLQDKYVAILWFGVREMRWKDLDSFFESKLKSNPTPDYLVVHLGFNDLGILTLLIVFNQGKQVRVRARARTWFSSTYVTRTLGALHWNGECMYTEPKDSNRAFANVENKSVFERT